MIPYAFLSHKFQATPGTIALWKPIWSPILYNPLFKTSNQLPREQASQLKLRKEGRETRSLGDKNNLYQGLTLDRVYSLPTLVRSFGDPDMLTWNFWQ